MKTAVFISNSNVFAADCGWQTCGLVNQQPSIIEIKEGFMKLKGLSDKAIVQRSAWRIEIEAFFNEFASRMMIVYALMVIVDVLVRYRMMVGKH